VQFPELGSTLLNVDRVTRKDDNVYLDAQAMAEGLFNDHMATNPLMIGAAYQAGALPISAGSIERAIRLNGVSVDMNLLAFRWGRMAVVDVKRVEAAVQAATGREARVTPLDPGARVLIDSVKAAAPGTELRRILESRVPELIAYQDERYARQYIEFVEKAAQAEINKVPGRHGLGEAVARQLHKLMAYKDEYEVARLHLDAALDAELRARFGEEIRVYWHLHPPLLRALGLTRKLKLGAWFRPFFRTLYAFRRLRGSPLDPFGYAEVRRVERALVAEYTRQIEVALRRLGPGTHDAAVALAELPDQIRGYEHVKLDNVKRYREAAAALLAKATQPA
jgi:indolepyruvate ferredoxin oxidoreductase